jgi:hypothetical protein
MQRRDACLEVHHAKNPEGMCVFIASVDAWLGNYSPAQAPPNRPRHRPSRNRRREVRGEDENEKLAPVRRAGFIFGGKLAGPVR